MLNRSSPRSRSARVIANGKTFGELAVELARVQELVLVEHGARRVRRGTVPATSGCAELPFGRKALASYGS